MFPSPSEYAFVAAQSRNPERRLLLAPRHLGRITALQHELRARGLRWSLRSNLAGAAFEPGSVLLIDTLGEGPTLLSKAAFVFVGGTLAPVGAHNVLEPAWARRAVLFGPHTSNVADAVERLRGAGAATPVADAAALRAAVIDAFERPDASAQQGEAAFRAVAAHCGAAERAADLVEQSLTPRPGGAPRVGPPGPLPSAP